MREASARGKALGFAAPDMVARRLEAGVVWVGGSCGRTSRLGITAVCAGEEEEAMSVDALLQLNLKVKAMLTSEDRCLVVEGDR